MSYHARRAYRPPSRLTRRAHADRVRHTGDTTVDLITNPPPGGRARATRPTNGGTGDTIDERNLRIRYALERLPEPQDRAIVVMRFFIGLNLRQIAFRLRMGIREVRERYGLCLRILEKELRGWL